MAKRVRLTVVAGAANPTAEVVVLLVSSARCASTRAALIESETGVKSRKGDEEGRTGGKTAGHNAQKHDCTQR